MLIPFSVQIDDSGYVALINRQSIVRTPFSARTTGFPFKRTTQNIDWSAVIAPFWADISTRGNRSGRIYFKNFTKGEEMQATADVRKLIASTIPQLRGFTPEWTLIITWDQVGYYPNHDDKVCIAWPITLYHDHGGLSHFSKSLCQLQFLYVRSVHLLHMLVIDLEVILLDSGAFRNAPESKRIIPRSSGFNAVRNSYSMLVNL